MEAVRLGQVDVVFTNATPARAKEIDFTQPYLEVEAGYLVAPRSALTSAADVDKTGVRVGVMDGSTSAVTLPELLTHASIVRIPSVDRVADMLARGDVDAFATNKSILFELSDTLPGSRVLAGRYGVEQLALGNAAAYDAIHRQRPGARVGLVTNLLDWRPDDPSRPQDVAASAHADQVFNRLFLDAAVRGVYDTNGNGATDPGERRPALRGKADFLGVNHYSPARAQGLGAPLTASIPLFDFSPRQVFAGHGSPMGPPCPTTCTDFGWEIDPQGLRHVLAEAAEYGRPLYVTENGIDDEEDDQRPGFLSSYVAAMHQAIDDGIDVRGYFHWSLVDNFEWAEGFRAHFGLYAFDPATLRRTARPSVRAFRRIAGGS